MTFYEELKERGFDKKIILDHNLYIFNQYGKEFWNQQKVEDFTAPLELNSRELRELDIRDGELLVYGRIPVMVSAQCIERTTSGCSKKPGVRVLQDRRDDRHYPSGSQDDCTFPDRGRCARAGRFLPFPPLFPAKAERGRFPRCLRRAGG